MLIDRLKELFESYDPSVQKVISGVLSIEQEYISMERPRVKDDIDNIVSSVANKEIEKIDSEENIQEPES